LVGARMERTSPYFRTNLGKIPGTAVKNGEVASFVVVCVMRRAVPVCPATSLKRFPISSSLPRPDSGNASIERSCGPSIGIAVVHTGYRSNPGRSNLLGVYCSRAGPHRDGEQPPSRSGGLAANSGKDLRGKTLGFWDLGTWDPQAGVAGLGAAFGMNLIAWRPDK